MSEENISVTVDELPTLYLGKDTTVYDNKWDFGNANVHLNNIPTQDNMVTNKSYVDSLYQQVDKKIDTILDGASVSVENFKNFVDFVNNNQRENEAELYNSIANISNSVLDEKNRAIEIEDTIKKDIDELRNRLDNNNSGGVNSDELKAEVIRATEEEHRINNQIDEVKASVQIEVNRANDAENRINNQIDEVKASVQIEVNRANEAENNMNNIIEEVKASVQIEVNRANEAEQNLRTELLEEIKKMGSPTETRDTSKLEEEIAALKGSEKALQDEINMLKEKMNAIYQYFFRNNATGGNKFNLRI
jgi:DNA repair exonuclease SbcCD ATPase subunit